MRIDLARIDPASSLPGRIRSAIARDVREKASAESADGELTLSAACSPKSRNGRQGANLGLLRASPIPGPAQPAQCGASCAAEPINGRKLRAKRGRPVAGEDQVQFAVVQHLRWLGRPDISWWHHPAGGWRALATGARLKALGARAGLPDILVLIDGRLHGLELKRERGGRLSAAQIAMHAELRAAGAVISTARGLDEALTILQAWGALKPRSI